jgi:hypothetical protein
MPRGHVMGPRSGVAGRSKASMRSASAARAHATGEVTWVVDLAVPPAARMSESADAGRRYAAAGLSLLAIALWTFNLGTLVMHAS